MRRTGQNVYRGSNTSARFRSDEEVIAVGNMTDVNSNDLYRLNVVTGRHALLTSGRPSEYRSPWILDGKLVPRVLVPG